MKFSLAKKITFTIIGLVFISNALTSLIMFVQAKEVIKRQVENDLAAKVEQYFEVMKSGYQNNIDSLENAILVAGEKVNNTSTEISTESLQGVSITNQITKESKLVDLPIMKIQDEDIYQKYSLTDKIAKLTDSAVTIFQLVDDGLLRVSTNIIKKDGNRATGTYIPVDSPVYKKIIAGEDFHGRAFVVSEWYLTIYRPLKFNGKVVGAIFVGKAENNLTTLKNKIREQKIGETGYAYILDEEGHLIVHKDLEGKNILNIKDENGKEFIQEILNNKIGSLEYKWKNPQGEVNDKIVSFKHFEELKWTIVAGMDSDEIYAPLTKIRNTFFLTTLSILIVCFIIAFFLQKTISTPLIKASEFLSQISHKLENSAGSIYNKSNSLKDATNTQASSLIQTTKSVSFIKATIEKNNGLIEKSTQTTQEGVNATKTGQEAINEMLYSIKEIEKSNEQVVNKIADSNSKMNEVTNIIAEIAEKADVINDIVFQTKLLSFNASVEAARAGEHGRGFSIVAEEVGKLASISGQSAVEIQNLLTDGINKVKQLTEATQKDMELITDENLVKINKGIEVANKCRSQFEDLANKIQESGNISSSVLEASQEQFLSIQEITAALEQLNQLTNSNLNISDETNTSAQGLKSDSDNLKEIVEHVERTVYGKSA